ncbi:hypothetical protein MUN84_08820 [Hymenobacter sp. 5516J-16]|uniref:hypothetical protein n=1 Tax=Hymenobacter sp. 5516J-16 TaxID=2932253 RepID=UPI001FD2F085|nr:hypothetical protein [Hymenobacter sp. 5516J-16]UOQ78622.1 hypothetical protein MUN84_08820 [Hymenobacter sp. 5516J-16]
MSTNAAFAASAASLASTAQPWRVGLIGFGCVGQGLFDMLNQQPESGFSIARIVVKTPGKVRPLPPSGLSTTCKRC